MPHPPTTRPSLIERMRQDDPAAWGEFLGRYQTGLLAWARERGLSHHDAEDAVAILLLELAVEFSEFDYDPTQRFRGYLWIRLRNVVSKLRKNRDSNRGVLALLGSDDVERNPLADRLMDLEEGVRLVGLISRFVDPETRALLYDRFVHGVSTAELQTRTGKSRATIYRILNRVAEELRQAMEDKQ